MLMQKFFSYSMDKSCNVATHINKLVNIASSLKALNTEITDSMIISKILVKLPDFYKSFVTAWEHAEYIISPVGTASIEQDSNIALESYKLY